jgi:hypothetical protein
VKLFGLKTLCRWYSNVLNLGSFRNASKVYRQSGAAPLIQPECEFQQIYNVGFTQGRRNIRALLVGHQQKRIGRHCNFLSPAGQVVSRTPGFEPCATNSWGFAELSGLLRILPGEAAVTPCLGGAGVRICAMRGKRG